MRPQIPAAIYQQLTTQNPSQLISQVPSQLIIPNIPGFKIDMIGAGTFEENDINEKEEVEKNIMEKKTSNYMTIYEKAKLIGVRAKQLEQNAPPMYDIGDEVDPVKIASKEFEMRRLPLNLERKREDGIVETWDPNTMIYPN